MDAFKADIEEIRRRARTRIDDGPITDAYLADRAKVIAVLNDVLATETVCTLRYKSHYYMAQGIHGEAIAGEFLEHAHDEQDHADRIAKRITELGGIPNFDPEGLTTRSHAQFSQGDDLEDMIREDLVAERIAVATYAEIVRWISDSDPTTRRVIEEILAKEEEHADDLVKLLVRVGGRPSDGH